MGALSGVIVLTVIVFAVIVLTVIVFAVIVRIRRLRLSLLAPGARFVATGEQHS